MWGQVGCGALFCHVIARLVLSLLTLLLLLCLQGFRSLLTDSQDASYLFNAVLDAVVDHTLPLVQVRAPPPRGASKCGVMLLQ